MTGVGSFYNRAEDLCVITSYFNPCNYRSLWNNYRLFRDSMQASGLKLVTVECAFGDAPFQLESGPDTLQVRTNAVLWQKERLLNIAFAHVRDSFSKVAWVDADLFFANPNWAVEASSLLDKYPLVQLFESVVQLPKGATVANGFVTTRPTSKNISEAPVDISEIGTDISEGTGKPARGFASIVSRDSSRLMQGYLRHGRTGFAWCATSAVLVHGIFDGCILGDGDHVMAHAMLGDWSSECIDLTFYTDQKSRAYFRQWAETFFEAVQGRISFLPDTIFHLWHGNPENRRYKARTEKLARFGVDPLVDLRLNSDSCWDWNTQRPALHDYVAKYFELRHDDYDGVLPNETASV